MANVSRVLLPSTPGVLPHFWRLHGGVVTQAGPTIFSGLTLSLLYERRPTPRVDHQQPWPQDLASGCGKSSRGDCMQSLMSAPGRLGLDVKNFGYVH